MGHNEFQEPSCNILQSSKNVISDFWKGLQGRITLMKKILVISVICILCCFATVSAYAAGESAETSAAGAEAHARADAKANSAANSASGPAGRMYGAGSVGKVYCAAAVMKLVDEGKIDLDTPVVSYIPEFKMADPRYTQITPRMLLNHSPGFRGFTPNNAILLGDNDTYAHDHFLDSLQAQTLKHDPGDRSIYCNDAFTLAELLVERVSGLSYTEYIEQSFVIPLGLEHTKTPQNDFDQGQLADIYWGNNELLPENFGVIGSGGVYASMEDLCWFATIFMDSADGSVLSKQSTDEMAKNQHRNEMVPQGADTIMRYGLGWDSVDPYPFNQLGIKALSKGGDSYRYHTNLTVLPEYNLAVAVSASGGDSKSQLVAQEIILAVLMEEGIIPEDAGLTMPAQNLERANVPESLKANAGLYDAGIYGLFSIEFTEDSLIFTPLLVRNERPQEYLYNTDGVFVSTNGDYFTLGSQREGSRGTTELSFTEDGYLVIQAYESQLGLSETAYAMPVAEKLEANDAPDAAVSAWAARNDKEYLLVGEKYSSVQYIGYPIAKTQTDERVYGYVSQGMYFGSGMSFPLVRIVDQDTALGFQGIPTMAGRDTCDLHIVEKGGVECLEINDFLYMDASVAVPFSEIGETLVLGSDPIWVDIDDESGGRMVQITLPSNGSGSWFAYDAKMNCIATSLEKTPRDTIVLPENGRLLFAGEPGTTFTVK